MALILSVLMRMPCWWWLINTLFPQAVLIGLTLHWPPEYFLFAFAGLWLAFSSIVRIRVPYYPTRLALLAPIEQHLPHAIGSALELGSGLGGWSLHLKQCRPSLQVTGVELAYLPWLVSWLRARFRDSGCRFLHGDYRQFDWSAYDVVYAYLSPLVMEAVWRQANQQMRPGSWLISCEFDIEIAPGHLMLPAQNRGTPAVYIWQIGVSSEALNEDNHASY